jgi:hypothetical protein
MIDSAIKLLETIVAMEEISDIDIDNNGIELGELFNLTDNGEEIDWNSNESWKNIEGWSDNA